VHFFYAHKAILTGIDICFIVNYYSAVKIVFLNIWDCTNKDNVKEFIEKHAQDTDVFCLQEAYEKTKWLCKDILLNYNMVADCKYLSDTDYFPQATYLKKDTNILFSETLLLNTPGTGLALYTHIQINDRDVHICNVHGVSEPGDKLDNVGRLRQSREIIERFRSLEGIKIIGGDFNLELNTKSLKMFEESGYRNLISEYKVLTTRNKFVWERFPESKQYFSDYVFVNRGLKVKEFSVPDVEVSDHLPMILVVDLDPSISQV